MSYRCEVCDVPQPDGTNCNFTVVETRTKTYESYNPKTKRGKTTQGKEIVRELKLCKSCHSKVNANIDSSL